MINFWWKTVPRKRIILFGASKGGQRAYRCWAHSHKILAFADNDPGKYGKTIFGKPVISPNDIPSYSYDHIYISCGSNFPVYLQLLGLGVESNKIRTVDQDIMLGAFELTKRQSFLVIFAIYGLLHILFDLGALLNHILA